MFYLEWLRVRRTLPWFLAVTVIIAAFVLFATYVGHHAVVVTETNGSVHTNQDVISNGSPITLPLAGFVAFGALGGLAMMFALSRTYNRETEYAHETFVWPIDRVRAGIEIAAVDLPAIFATAIVYGFLAFGLTSLSFGARAHFVGIPSDVVAVAVRSACYLAAWYGLLQLVTAWSPSKAGAWVGVTSAAFFIAPGLREIPYVGPIARVVCLVDPNAYLTSITVTGDATNVSSIADPATSTIVLALLAIVSLPLAIALWTRVEV